MPTVQVQQKNVPKNHEIKIYATKSGVFAKPGKPRIKPGETVVFNNETKGRLKIRLASGKVLKGLNELDDLHVPKKDKSKKFETENNPGTHEYSAHYKFKDSQGNWRKGFAEGATSPKIIVVRP